MYIHREFEDCFGMKKRVILHEIRNGYENENSCRFIVKLEVF